MVVHPNRYGHCSSVETAYTPEGLIAPEEAEVQLYTEADKARDGIKVQSIERVALTYAAVRAENKKDGMVFAPVWQVLFKEAGQSEEYTSWVEFNAINGSVIDAIFR